MDNNPTPQAPAATQPAPVPQPVVPQTPPVVATPNSGGSNKLVLYFVIGLILIVLLLAGAYLFMSRQQQAAKNNSTETTPQEMVQATPKPQETVDALDRDLSALNIENTDSDFSSIDTDLQQL